MQIHITKKNEMNNVKYENIIIYVGNVNSKILASEYLLSALQTVFSYEVKDASYIRDAKIDFYMKRNKLKEAKKWVEWDGRFSVFKGHTFGTGILGDVMMYLYDKGYDVELIDNMKKPDIELYEDSFVHSLNHILPELWEHQKNALQSLIDNESRGVLHISTGGGKTLIACKLIYYLSVPTIIIVEKKEIMEQWKEKINNYFYLEEKNINGASGSIWFSEFKPILLLCTSRLLNSVLTSKKSSKANTERNKIIKEIVKNSGLLIYDEVHHAAAKEARRVISKIPAYHRVGLTATANMRDDNADYEYLALIGNIVYQFSPSELVESGKGTAIDIKILSPSYDPDWISTISKIHEYKLIYNTFIVNNNIRNSEILRVVLKEVNEGNSVLVLVDRVSHARQLSAILGENIADYTWSGEDKELRRSKVENFKSGNKLAFFCTYSLGGEGFDYPDLNVVVLAGGKSETKIRQSLGRIMRKKSNGSNAILYDFADIINPFRNHFIDRMKVYKSEDVFNVKKYPKWVKKYV